MSERLSADTRVAILKTEIAGGLLQMAAAAGSAAGLLEAEGAMRESGRCELAAMKLQIAMCDVLEAFGENSEAVRARLYALEC